MFFKLVFRNSVRSHKENALFLGSLVISIIAFYVVLSLSNQDVMRYLQGLESNAIKKLFAMITVLYGFTLFIIFALIYYASKYQIERRSHEFGVYIMMGMKRLKLFLMLLLEDLGSTFLALLIGLPISVLITEVISLLTVKMVGIGFMGHQSTFSLHAALLTIAGFVAVKFVAFLILSFKLARKEVGTLLTDAPDNVRKKGYPVIQALLLVLGIALLIVAYREGISGRAWEQVRSMGKTVVTGVAGTILFFRGIRFLIGLIAKHAKSGKLPIFTFRQIEDTVIFKSGTLAICSLLILVSSACLSAGVGTFASYNMYDTKRIDYTFTNLFRGKGADPISKIESIGLTDEFSYLGEIHISHPYAAEDAYETYQEDEFIAIMDELDPENQYYHHYSSSMGSFPFMIRLSDYNNLIVAMGGEALELQDNEIGLYRSEDAGPGDELDNAVLARHPHVTLGGKEYVMAGTVQRAPIVTDRFITLFGALIVPDAAFDELAGDMSEVYVNGVLDKTRYTRSNMVENYMRLNRVFDRYGFDYESYLQNMGRQLFYLVAASYVTIYLALIFLVVANTILGVQFLMGQKRTSKRYKTLVKLGTDHKTLYRSSKTQINWYFGLPIAVAGASTYFATRALYNGILSSRTKVNMNDILPLVLIAVVFFVLVECLYMHIVKRSSSRFLETLMTPEREE